MSAGDQGPKGRAAADNPLVVALDVADLERAQRLSQQLAGEVGLLKVGLELFVAHGPRAVQVVSRYAPVFLDLKL
ncbi:MAG TPA: orotidine 5'-phosphate decarboxylase / HUMPS family protein, partial [Nitriliruptorales bacterium]|nr:orotidine 5'-phosphate decarboxylase / HUMPS family protein [Nitriliruptorales bacterium]